MANFSRQCGKKVRLKLDVCTGLADPEEVFALLDGVNSDDEDDIDNLVCHGRLGY